MLITMAGIDHTTAGIDRRQRFAIAKDAVPDTCRKLQKAPNVRGAVLLSTCNRTELYLSCQGPQDPAALLCQLAGAPAAWGDRLAARQGREAFVHLCQLACGAKSQIWGEDQIITQVKAAIALSREAGAADSALEVLFRTAITAAKRIKTEVRFGRGGQSVATQALAAIQAQPQAVGRALVIGNGEVGRMTARALTGAGVSVAMTVRRYRHAAVPLPEGVRGVEYDRRYEYLPGCDAVISATSSPHCTIGLEPFSALARRPRLLLDLAVPRDIDPAIGALPGVSLLDIDGLGCPALREEREQLLRQADQIIARYYTDFIRWQSYRSCAGT